jgi:hypothetical protein
VVAVLFGELTPDNQSIVLVAQGDDWELDQIAARLRTLTPAVKLVQEDGRPTDAAIVPATWATVVQLGFSFNGYPGFSWEPQPRLAEWTIAETVRQTSPVPPLPAGLYPPWVTRTPRDYQLDGAAQIAAEGKFLLLDDPGVGKTATMLLGLQARRKAGTGIFPLLIVVPSWEVGQAWIDEIAAWGLDWPEPVLHRGPQRFGRAERPKGPPPGESVFITTYATLRIDAADMRGPLVRLRPAAVTADEFHLTMNNASKQSLALRRVARHAATVTGLSGTGIKHDTGDVHPMLEAMDPASWPSKERMVARFCARITDEYNERITGLNPAAETEFFAIMDRQMRRVAKADVLPQLPPKIYSVRKPEIPDEWVKAYRSMEEDMLAQLPDGDELPVMSVLVQLMRLSQLASSAADVTRTEELDPVTGLMTAKYAVTLKAPSWKAESLLGIMAERPGQQVVCFTASRQLAMITGKYCQDAGYRTGYIAGIGGGITNRTRQAAIGEFQAGKLDVIVAMAKVGGTGITLTAASTVVFLQRDWELDHGTQPEDRAHRLGQEHDCVEIIDVVARGTVEDRVRQRLREKAGMLGQFVRDRRLVKDILGGIK